MVSSPGDSGVRRSRTHLIRFHLQTGRGLIEDVVPPVEGELISFLMADLENSESLKNRVYTTPPMGEQPEVTHPSFVTLHFDLDGFRYAVLPAAQSFT